MAPEDKMTPEEQLDAQPTESDASGQVDHHMRPIKHHDLLPADGTCGETAENDGAFRATSENADEASLPTEPPSENLHIAAEKLGLVIDAEKLDHLERYCRLLWEWNEKINLTRHTDFDLFARRDLLDSWHLAQQLAEGEDVLDVGTGGGVPGIPLAILRPDLNVSLCDSVAKKSKVVDDMVMQLKLPVPVHAMRVQDVLEDWRYSSLVTRAVGSLTQLAGWLKDYWHCFDRMLAIKGPRWVEERGEARHRGLLGGIELRKLVSYNMPGTSSESVVLQLKRPRR